MKMEIKTYFWHVRCQHICETLSNIWAINAETAYQLQKMVKEQLKSTKKNFEEENDVVWRL